MTRATNDLHGVTLVNNPMTGPELAYLTVTKVMKGMTFLDRDNETFNATGDEPYTTGVLFFMGLGEEVSSKKVKTSKHRCDV